MTYDRIELNYNLNLQIKLENGLVKEKKIRFGKKIKVELLEEKELKFKKNVIGNAVWA